MAFRICALDPYCLEAAIGAARTPPGRRKDKKTGKSMPGIPSPLVYYTVCFVQVNDKLLVAEQDRAFRELLQTAAGREPAHIRALGLWGRKGVRTLLENATRDPRPEVTSAVFDATLLLDEPRARKALARREKRARELLGRGQYADALAM